MFHTLEFWLCRGGANNGTLHSQKYTVLNRIRFLFVTESGRITDPKRIFMAMVCFSGGSHI